MDTNGNYIQNQFCSYEIAQKLKSLGFDELCMALYFREEFRFIGINQLKETNSQINNIDIIDAPLWQQSLDWLRKKHGLYVYFKPDKPNNIGDVEFVIEKHWPDKIVCKEICMIYEHAREDGILKALTLIK